MLFYKETCEIKPHVNQFEMHPLLPQTELVKFCQDHDILVVSYSTLGCGHLSKHPKINSIAKSLGISSAQVLLSWARSKGVAVIPKSVHKERIIENINCDTILPIDAILTIDNLAHSEGETRYCWDPTYIR